MTTSAGDGNRREYLTIARNHFTQFDGSRVNFAAYITYSNSRSIFEMNRISASAVMEGFFVKGPHYLTSNRANVIDQDVTVSNSRGGVTAVHFTGLNEWDPSFTGYVEHCWNFTPTGHMALLDRAAALDGVLPNPNYVYRNTSNGVITHTKQRENVRWHIFNNVTVGAFGVATDRPSGRWPSYTGIWPTQNGNAHVKADLLEDGQLAGSLSRLQGFKGSGLKRVSPWPQQREFGGIKNLASFSALNSKTLEVTLGPGGRNRMLVVVSFQSGGNGRGQGYHLDGVYGQNAIFNRTSYDNVIIAFFEDMLLPLDGGAFILQSAEGGTESVFAIYAEGVAQRAPNTLFRNGSGISGNDQFEDGKPGDLVVYGALLHNWEDLTIVSGQDPVLQGNSSVRHQGLWRLGSDYRLGLNGYFDGILNAAVFEPATQQSGDFLDSNGDGIPDSWYSQHGLNHRQIGLADQIGANGHTMRESYLLNMDPHSSSGLRMVMDGEGRILIRHPNSWTTYRYTLQHAETLEDEFVEVEGDLLTGSEVNMDLNGPTGFYRFIYVHEE